MRSPPPGLCGSNAIARAEERQKEEKLDPRPPRTVPDIRDTITYRPVQVFSAAPKLEAPWPPGYLTSHRGSCFPRASLIHSKAPTPASSARGSFVTQSRMPLEKSSFMFRHAPQLTPLSPQHPPLAPSLYRNMLNMKERRKGEQNRVEKLPRNGLTIGGIQGYL